MVNRYGLLWPEEMDPLEVEFMFIRNKGYIEEAGVKFGNGPFYHYRAAMSLVWPDDDHHRWSDLMLARKTENEILVMMGPSDCNKTYSTSRYILIDYWASHTNTLWMVSTTEVRGAELRIWGKIKELFNRGKERYPWLAGIVLESKYCITTEEISRDGEMARLLTKGIIFIPCKSGERWVGLGAYAGIKPTKNGRLGHAGDEVSVMHTSFLQAYSNWYGKPNFQGILDGNPFDLDDPLCIAAEPEDGWAQWQDTKKTQEWRSKWYGAWVICFDGRDSPNFDLPLGQFPYMIGPKKIEAVKKTEGEDSALFWSQCVGKPRPGAEARRVITRQICEEGKAFEKVIWEGTDITDAVGLDAAYGGVGGDRCVLFHIRFGRDVDGRNVIACKPPVLVPVSTRTFLKDPETQIAEFVANYLKSFNVPASHFGFDSRATLAMKIAAYVGNEANAIEFGGPATDRPVSNNEFIWDGDTKTRRLKKCVEHYFKFVTELWFSLRYLIVGSQVRELPQEVAEEGWKRMWNYTKGAPPRIEVEPKDEMKKRTTRSPDLFDGLVIAVEMARRLGFAIEGLKDLGPSKNEDQDWLEKELSKFKTFVKRHELKYQ